MSFRLCFLVPAHWEAIMGGSQYQAKVLIDYLLKDYDVEISYLTVLSDPEFRPQGYEIVQFSDRGGLRRYGFFFDAMRLYRALARIKPDAILQYVGSAHTGIAAFYARRNGCRMIWRVTNDNQVTPETAPWWRVHRHIDRWFLNYGIARADMILAQTRYQKSQLALRHERSDAIVVPNFHPTPPDATRAAASEKRVVWVANLKPQKNPAAFVRLARRFADRSDVRFVMIGRAMDDGPWTREQFARWTREQLALISATPNIEYLGERRQEQVNAELERAELLVCTSDYEGFSNTFIQAWLRRVPVVSLHVDPDGLLSRSGLGVVSHDEERLYGDVAALLDGPAERLAMGARCRQYATENHGESNAREIAELLDVRSALPVGQLA